MKVAHAIRWSNGNVTAFDEAGQQIPDLQGRYEDVRADVLNASTETTTFTHGILKLGETVVERADW